MAGRNKNAHHQVTTDGGGDHRARTLTPEVPRAQNRDREDWCLKLAQQEVGLPHPH